MKNPRKKRVEFLFCCTIRFELISLINNYKCANITPSTIFKQ